MGGYDLYGNYYSRSIDAENAEMAQCAEIDAKLNEKKMRLQQENNDHALGELHNRIIALEEEVSNLKEVLKVVSIHAPARGAT